MQFTVDRVKLAEHFTTLCEISSPSRSEKRVSDHLKTVFGGFNPDFVFEDDSAAATGSDCGNLIFRFDGTTSAPPLFFACHMDTVQPGENIKVRRDGDIFSSTGQTILGGDDKSGIAPLIEMIRQLKESGTPHRTIEIIFTTCEEIGLLGAKSLNHHVLQSSFGYALDSSGTNKVIVGAPASNRLRIDVYGTSAHAGISPETGVNAIAVAAQAITQIKLGRIDEESTANFGIIEGGIATNIIPNHLMIKGEVRSHSTAKLQRYTEDMKTAFTNIAASWPAPEKCQPKIDFKVEADYPAMRLSETDPVVQTVMAAGASLGRHLDLVIAGGGSDANIYNGNGLSTAIISTGMNKVHTVDECLDLNDMVELTELLLTIAVQ